MLLFKPLKFSLQTKLTPDEIYNTLKKDFIEKADTELFYGGVVNKMDFKLRVVVPGAGILCIAKGKIIEEDTVRKIDVKIPPRIGLLFFYLFWVVSCGIGIFWNAQMLLNNQPRGIEFVLSIGMLVFGAIAFPLFQKRLNTRLELFITKLTTGLKA
jgi:hypothetical protein